MTRWRARLTFLLLLASAAALIGARVTYTRQFVPGPFTIQSGQLLLPDGTAAAPSLARSATPDVGFRFLSNEIRVSLSGTDRLSFVVGGDSVGALQLASDGHFDWSSGVIGTASDVVLRRDAANTLAQRNGLNAQTFRLYNTFTSSTNFERVTLAATATNADIYAEAGSAGGTPRPLRFGANGTLFWHIAASGDGSLGAVTDNASDMGASGTNRPRDLFLARNQHVAGFLHVQSALALGAHTVTIANNAVGASANTEILSGLRSLYLVSCNDPDGCTIQLAETSVAVGTLTKIINIDANTLTWADIAGVQHTAASFSMGPADAVSAVYVVNRSGDSYWVEYARSDN